MAARRAGYSGCNEFASHKVRSRLIPVDLQYFVECSRIPDLCFFVGLFSSRLLHLKSVSNRNPSYMPASPKNETATAEYSADKSNQLIDYVESLVESNDQHSSNGSFLVELIDEKFDLLSARLQEQIGDLFESLASQLNIENLDKKASTSSPNAFSNCEPMIRSFCSRIATIGGH